jgi:hypothetical protein
MAYPRTRLPRERGKNLIIAGVFFLIGLGVALYGLTALSNAEAAKAWPTAEGTILSSRCERFFNDWQITYEAMVTYTYSVAGKRYEWNTIAFGYNGGWWRLPNRRIADRFPPGSAVTVRYDPSEPWSATLSVGLNLPILGWIFLGSWIMLVSGAVIRHVLRGWPDRTAFVTVSHDAGDKTSPPNPSDRGRTGIGLTRLSRRSLRLTIATRGVGGIILLALIGLLIAWLGGLAIDLGIP